MRASPPSGSRACCRACPPSASSVPCPGRNGGGARYEIFHDVLGAAVLEWGARYEAEQALVEERRAARRRNRRFAFIAVVRARPGGTGATYSVCLRPARRSPGAGPARHTGRRDRAGCDEEGAGERAEGGDGRGEGERRREAVAEGRQGRRRCASGRRAADRDRRGADRRGEEERRIADDAKADALREAADAEDARDDAETSAQKAPTRMRATNGDEGETRKPSARRPRRSSRPQGAGGQEASAGRGSRLRGELPVDGRPRAVAHCGACGRRDQSTPLHRSLAGSRGRRPRAHGSSASCAMVCWPPARGRCCRAAAGTSRRSRRAPTARSSSSRRMVERRGSSSSRPGSCLTRIEHGAGVRHGDLRAGRTIRRHRRRRRRRATVGRPRPASLSPSTATVRRSRNRVLAGRTLVATAAGQAARFWDAASGDCLCDGCPPVLRRRVSRSTPAGTLLVVARDARLTRSAAGGRPTTLNPDGDIVVPVSRPSGRSSSRRPRDASDDLGLDATARGCASSSNTEPASATSPGARHATSRDREHRQRGACLGVAHGEPLTFLGAHSNHVTSDRVQPGRRLHRDGVARWLGADLVWATFRAERAMLGHGASPNDVIFAPDGRAVLTASDDGSARMWSPAVDPPLVLRGPARRVAEGSRR